MNMVEQDCDYFAVNLFDLVHHMEPNQFTFVGTLLEPVITEDVVVCEGDWISGLALMIRRDISLSKWMGIVGIIRYGIGIQPPTCKKSLRIYRSETGKGWDWEQI